MSDVVDFLEARQNMTQPRYAPRRLNSQKEKLPYQIAVELEARFIGLFKGVRSWIGLSSQGHVYTVDVVQTGPDAYSFEAMFADPVGQCGPAAA